MAREEVFEFLLNNRDISVRQTLKQRWKQDRFSYLLTPRPDYGLMLLLSGHITFIFNEERLVINAGDVVFLPKGSFYEAVFEKDTEDYLVNFDLSESAQIPSDLGITLLVNDALDSCAKSFSELIDENPLKSDSFFKTQGLFYLLLDSIYRRVYESDSPNIKLMQRVKDMLCEADEKSISEIASRCGMSESGLRKKFKDSVGVSPAEYRINAKLSRAKNMLEATDMTVNEISDKLNFYDAAYFCKVFKRHVGVTPKEYLKNKRL